MSTVTDNKNFLSPVGMAFTLQRALNCKFTCQQANLPSISGNPVNIPTPFVTMPMGYDTITFNEFTMTFIVNEDLDNYLELQSWMFGIGFPESYEQHKGIASATPGSGTGIVSDGTLLIMNSAMKPNFEVTYKNMMPISLSDLQLDVTQEGIEYLVCTASFRYETFEIRKTT